MPSSSVSTLCSGCDYYNPDLGKCSICNENDQELYAQRGICGFGQVQGLRVSQITYRCVRVGKRKLGKNSKELSDAIEDEKLRPQISL